MDTPHPSPTDRPRTLPAPAGFTLIELLVVISIIAVLAGLLLPAISAVRNTANSTVCASQFRQLGMGVLLYTTDWKGYLPPSRFQGCAPADLGYAAGITANWTNEPWVGRYIDTALPPVGDSCSTAIPSGPWRCPSDRLVNGASRLKNVSYGLNFSLCPYANSVADLPAYVYTKMIPLRRLRAAGALLLGAEALESRWYWPKGAWPNLGFWDQATNSPAWVVSGPQPVNAWQRHQQRGNFLFADGHVELRGDPTPEVTSLRLFIRHTDVP